jgi:hypothetical protein
MVSERKDGELSIPILVRRATVIFRFFKARTIQQMADKPE